MGYAFFQGQIKSLSVENAKKIESALGLRLISSELTSPYQVHNNRVAQKAATLADRDPHFRAILEAYCSAIEGKSIYELKETDHHKDLYVAEEETPYE